MKHNFAVFILSHGRPDNVYTVTALERAGYTGKIYILIDNEDATADRYIQNFGDRVLTFDKKAMAERVDDGDNFNDRRAVVYARNACFEIAKQLGITYFMELDDDYRHFDYELSKKQHTKYVRNLDRLLELLLDYYISIPAKSIALAQGGDFIGGFGEFNWSINKLRKCMNTFICSVDRPFPFVGKINEDVTAYIWYQSMGNLFLTIPSLAIRQHRTQHMKGGLTDIYLDSGTYVKTFYTVMYAPSSVHVGVLRDNHKRLHHRIKWDNAIPCIVSEKYRKASSV